MGKITGFTNLQNRRFFIRDRDVPATETMLGEVLHAQVGGYDRSSSGSSPSEGLVEGEFQ